MSHSSSPLGPHSVPSSSSFQRHITHQPSSSFGSGRPNKRVKVDHDQDSTGPSGPASGSGSRDRTRSYSMREADEVDDEEREPEYVGDPANLEQYRKEAIYLSLLSSKRRAFRTQRRVRELEQQLNDLKYGVVVVERVWGDVLNLLENAAHGREGAVRDIQIPSLIESLKDPTLENQLQQRIPPVQKLLTRLFSSSSSSEPLANFYLSTTLESALQSLRVERDELIQKYDTVVLELDQVKYKCDRLKLEFERGNRGQEGQDAVETVKRDVREIKSEASLADETKADGQKLLKEEGDKAALEDKLAGTNGNHHAETNGQILTAANDHENLLARLQSKEAEIDRLSDEKTRLQSEMDFLKEVAWNPTEDAVMASAAFRTLKAEFEEQRTGADEAKRMGEVAEKRADELVLNQEGFKAAIEYSYNQKFESLDRLVRAKDSDIARLRGQRDAIREENDLLKGEKQVTFASVDESSAIVVAAEDRIKAMQSEMLRLRRRTAAEVGEKSYLGYLLNKSPQELEYVRSLELKIVEATDREKALQEQLKSYMRDRDSSNMTGLMRAETRAREETEKYKRMFEEREAAAKNGPQADLLAQVEQKSKQIERLEGMLEEREAVTMTLYNEVESLSSAYDKMETLATKKVYNLKALETQALEAMTVKAKAEHKYFAECRKSAALYDQQQAIGKTLEVQRTALDNSRRVEDELRSQLAGQEKELVGVKNKYKAAVNQVQRLETDVVRYRAEAEEHAHRAEGREKINGDRLEELKAVQAENRSLKTEIEETKHKLKQSQTMLKSTQSKGVSAGEVALQKERDMLFGILRCTACHLRFKTKILASCLHTFCDECITARLANRNRKCITCMKPFAESDVKNLF